MNVNILLVLSRGAVELDRGLIGLTKIMVSYLIGVHHPINIFNNVFIWLTGTLMNSTYTLCAASAF